MNAETGQCFSEKYSYTGSLAPISEEVSSDRYPRTGLELILGFLKLSMHFRGPATLKQLAVFYPGSSHNKRNTLGKSNVHRHGHRHFHEKRDSPVAERAVGDMVVATIDGQVVSWINEYAGPGAERNTAAAAPPAPAQTTLSTSVGSPKQPSSTSVPEPAAGASSQGTKSTSDHDSAHGGSGSWSRKAYYNADTGSSDGFTFLNHFGGTQGMPGTADGGPAYVSPLHLPVAILH